MARWGLIAAVAALLAVSQLPASAGKPEALDEETGLVVDEHFERVRANCTGCHSARIITQARLSRGDWSATLRWMKAKQGLWPIPSATENQILDYLVRHYGPGESAPRRKPLARSLRPPRRANPTPSETTGVPEQ